MEKEIRIFDTANNVLKVTGIRFELYDAGSGTLLDTKNSGDLNPPGSNEWGVKLVFAPTGGPLEVFTSDPNHKYPGNTIRSLEGQNTNRIDIDLSKVPATTGGQSSTLSSTDPVTVTHWVQSAPAWSDDEKRAVTNFVFNYMALLGLRDFVEKKGELNHLVKDWEIELKKLGIEINPLQANEWVILDHF
jgi:hypothetical protein